MNGLTTVITLSLLAIYAHQQFTPPRIAAEQVRGMLNIPGGSPCLPVEQSRYCSAWKGARVSGNLMNYFRTNPNHGITSVPIVSTIQDFDKIIMEDIFLSESTRKTYYKNLIGCDLDGLPVRYMISYFCAVLLSYSPGCFDPQPVVPLCYDTCSQYTNSIQTLVNQPATCDRALVGTKLNVPQQEPLVIEPRWLCSLRLLEGNQTCVNGAMHEQYCGWTSLKAGCADLTCRDSTLQGTCPLPQSAAAEPNILQSPWICVVLYTGIAVAACGISALLVSLYMYTKRRKLSQKTAHDDTERTLVTTYVEEPATDSESSMTRPTLDFVNRRPHCPPALNLTGLLPSMPYPTAPVLSRGSYLTLRHNTSSVNLDDPPLSWSPHVPASLLSHTELPPQESVYKISNSPGTVLVRAPAQTVPQIPPRRDSYCSTNRRDSVCSTNPPRASFHSPDSETPARASIIEVYDSDAGTSSLKRMNHSNSTKRAHMAYTADQPDELTVEIGHMLLVLEVYEDGWANGYNWTSQCSGVFPLAVFHAPPEGVQNLHLRVADDTENQT